MTRSFFALTTLSKPRLDSTKWQVTDCTRLTADVKTGKSVTELFSQPDGTLIIHAIEPRTTLTYDAKAMNEQVRLHEASCEGPTAKT